MEYLLAIIVCRKQWHNVFEDHIFETFNPILRKKIPRNNYLRSSSMHPGFVKICKHNYPINPVDIERILKKGCFVIASTSVIIAQSSDSASMLLPSFSASFGWLRLPWLGASQ